MQNGNYRFAVTNRMAPHMPKLIYSTPKYRRHKASGRAIVTLDGKDHYLGPYGSKESREAYDRLIEEHLARKRQPAVDANDLTVTELAIRYWEFARDYYAKDAKRNGETACIKSALRFLRSTYGDAMASKFGPLCLEVFQRKMVEVGLSRPYVNHLCAYIRRAFRWGVAKELVPVAVHQALLAVSGLKKGKTTAPEPEPVGPVPPEVVDGTLPFLPPVVADMVRFQRLVGCRPGEVCAIRPCDVDRSGEVWCYVPASHKTEHCGKERRIFIGPKAQGILTPYLLRDHEAYCFSPRESRRKQCEAMRADRKTKVQPSQIDRRKRKPLRTPGECYNKDSYNHAIRRAVDKANRLKAKEAEERGVELKEEDRVPHWHPNQLRHAVATKVRKEYGIEAAQTVLGHSNADVTLIYAERDFDLAKRIMREVG